MPAARLTSPAAQQAQAEKLAGRFPALLLQAEQIAACVAAGVHGRRRAGTGEQFWQYRRYQPGDPANRIDWRASARTPHALVQEKEWETSQTALLWLDRSASLDWRSTPRLPSKAERAELLLLALADLLLRGGERVGLLASPFPAASGRGLLQRLALQMARLPEGHALPPAGLPHPRHARIVLFGDFLDPVPELAARLSALFRQGLHGHLVQIADPAELDFTYEGRIEFTGIEEKSRYLAPRAERLQQAYLNALAEHQAALQTLTARLGWTLTRHRTDARPETALLTLYQALTTPC